MHLLGQISLSDLLMPSGKQYYCQAHLNLQIGVEEEEESSNKILPTF